MTASKRKYPAPTLGARPMAGEIYKKVIFSETG